MLLADASLSLTDRKRSRDGYLVARAKFARAGVYRYSGQELGRPDLDVVRVYRPVTEVFSARAMRSFALVPITNDHPPYSVDSATWRRHAIGEVGAEIGRDGDFVTALLTIRDAEAIRAIEDGKSGLSAGYTTDLEWIDGVAPDGTPYQAIQRHISGNHIAVVFMGRAGIHCRIR